MGPSRPGSRPAASARPSCGSCWPPTTSGVAARSLPGAGLRIWVPWQSTPSAAASRSSWPSLPRRASWRSNGISPWPTHPGPKGWSAFSSLSMPTCCSAEPISAMPGLSCRVAATSGLMPATATAASPASPSASSWPGRSAAVRARSSWSTCRSPSWRCSPPCRPICAARCRPAAAMDSEAASPVFRWIWRCRGLAWAPRTWFCSGAGWTCGARR